MKKGTIIEKVKNTNTGRWQARFLQPTTTLLKNINTKLKHLKGI